MGTDITFQNGTVVTPDWLNEVNALKETDYPNLLQQVNAHQAEKAQDGVHGLGNRPMVSTATTNYYIDAENGADTNDGLSVETAFKTWNKLKTLIPRFIYHNLTIKVIGNLESILLEPVSLVNGTLIIAGNTTTPNNQTINNCTIRSCLGGYDNASVIIRYIKISSNISIQSSTGITIENCELMGAGSYGALMAKMSKVWVVNCDFGTGIVQDAVVGYGNSDIISQNNVGNATRYGLLASYNSRIGKTGTQPTGTSANEYVSGGSVIA